MSRSFSEFLKTRSAAYSVLVFGVIISLSAFWYATENIKEKEFLRFKTDATEATILVKDRMDAYRETLYAGVGLFDSSVNVERDEWHRFVKALRIDKNFPGIQGFGFSEAIHPEEKETHIKKIRAEGFSDYTIKPEGIRKFYTSIIYLEPFDERNRKAFGYDMFSNDVRREAMIRAASSGESALSGKVRLVQESNIDEQAGFLMYVPVYHKGMPTKTPEERLSALEGFVYAPFRAKNLMNGVLGNQYKDIVLEIYDGPTTDPKNLLFAGGHNKPDINAIPIKTQLAIDGRVWTLCFKPLIGFADKEKQGLPWFILALGILISFTLFRVVLTSVKTKEKELEKSEFRLHLALQHSHMGVWELDLSEYTAYSSLEGARIFGYESLSSQWSYEMFIAHVYPDDRPKVNRLFNAAVTNQADLNFECRIHRADGEIRWIWVNATHKRDNDDVKQHMIGIVQDITERKISEEALLRSELSLKKAQEIAHVGNWELDLSTNHLKWSDEIYHILELDPCNVPPSHETFLNSIHPDDRDNVSQIHKSYLEQQQPYTIDHRLLMPDGKVKWVREVGDIEYDANGTPYVFRGTVQDITEQVRLYHELQTTQYKLEEANHVLKEKNDMLHQLAMYDGLTQIPNRRSFDELYDKKYKDISRNKKNLAVLMIDVDYFKLYNDHYGHAAGDQCLVQVAQSLKKTLKRPTDIVARYGGEEFIVLLDDVDIEGAQKVADSLTHAISALQIPHQYSKVAKQVTISIGIAFKKVVDTLSKDELLKKADEGLYAAKAHGRNRSVVAN